MKSTLLIILLFTFNVSFGQSTNVAAEFSRKDFIHHNLTSQSAYSFTVKKNGKLKTDSLLLFKKRFDLAKNKISGIKHYYTMVSHGPSYLTWYKFETLYNDNGLVIKETERPIVDKTKKKTDYNDYDLETFEQEFYYDNLQRLVKETSKSVQNDTLFFGKDILYSTKSDVMPKIDEYVYNSENLKVLRYYAIDSTRYYKNKSGTITTELTCLSCSPKYLFEKWQYDSAKKLTVNISYIDNGRIHTKKNFYYDEKGRIAKQIDSTGWYLISAKPYLDATTTFEYLPTGKVVTKIKYPFPSYDGKNDLHISQFDINENLISHRFFFNGSEDCTEDRYAYDDNKRLIKSESFSKGKLQITIEFIYDNKGMLKEERTFENDKLNALIRYYYN